MADLFDIKKVAVGKEKLCARVRVADGAPLMTSEDIEATARVYYLAPAIAKHLCLGDAGREFRDCMGATELAHLLEHLSVEILNQTGLAGKVSCGRTRAVAGEERTYDVELSCPDDALTIGALSSAVFMMEWAYLASDQPAPDFEGTVEALRHLALSLRPDGGASERAGETEADVASAGAAEPEAEQPAAVAPVVDAPAPADATAAFEAVSAPELELEPEQPGLADDEFLAPVFARAMAAAEEEPASAEPAYAPTTRIDTEGVAPVSPTVALGDASVFGGAAGSTTAMPPKPTAPTAPAVLVSPATYGSAPASDDAGATNVMPPLQ